MLFPTVWRSTSPLMTDGLFRLGRDFDRRFDDIANSVFSGSRWGGQTLADWTPSVDVVESPDDYRISLDLPGMSADEIDVTIQNNVLSVTGQRAFDHGEDQREHTYYCRERRYGRFERRFTLPDSVVAEEMQAEYVNGVLSIVLPKQEAAKPRRIQIRGAENGQARIGSGRSVES